MKFLYAYNVKTEDLVRLEENEYKPLYEVYDYKAECWKPYEDIYMISVWFLNGYFHVITEEEAKVVITRHKVWGIF